MVSNYLSFGKIKEVSELPSPLPGDVGIHEELFFQFGDLEFGVRNAFLPIWPTSGSRSAGNNANRRLNIVTYWRNERHWDQVINVKTC